MESVVGSFVPALPPHFSFRSDSRVEDVVTYPLHCLDSAGGHLGTWLLPEVSGVDPSVAVIVCHLRAQFVGAA